MTTATHGMDEPRACQCGVWGLDEKSYLTRHESEEGLAISALESVKKSGSVCPL